MKCKPTLIIHGGAGALSRSSIPPHLYDQYQASLLAYLRSTRDLLNSGSSALDAAVHAVSLLEDDELFNCARGSVFTSAGTIEMEASVMVTSLNHDPSPSYADIYHPNNLTSLNDPNPNQHPNTYPGSIKRGVGVIGLRNVRHPIQLAREVLLRDGLHDTDGGTMHSQLSAPYVEDLARDWGLEFQPDEYFWTKRRWEEHVRKLRQGRSQGLGTDARSSSSSEGEVTGQGPRLENPEPEVQVDSDTDLDIDLNSLPQGTVGCVCLDQYGNLAVATSTGGMTNKLPGRVGDTPTLGAGFWAERWVESGFARCRSRSRSPLAFGPGALSIRESEEEEEDEEEEDRLFPWTTCLPCFLRRKNRSSSLTKDTTRRERYTNKDTQRYRPTTQKPERGIPPPPLPDEKSPLIDYSSSSSLTYTPPSPHPHPHPHPQTETETKTKTKPIAIALSGTGNGDSFLRTCAARTACAMARFSPHTSLSQAVREVAGPGGELQRSAEDRWGSGEGEGGMIGIEVRGGEAEAIARGTVVFDFNCGGMWRAWVEEDGRGGEVERVMVFWEEFY